MVNGEKKNFSNEFVYRVAQVLKAMWIILSETINILRKLHETNIFGMPPKILPQSYVHYIAPSSGHILLNLICLLNWFLGGLRLFSDVWSENAALFEFIQIHQYYTME